jgi:hypothetical protein
MAFLGPKKALKRVKKSIFSKFLEQVGKPPLGVFCTFLGHKNPDLAA